MDDFCSHMIYIGNLKKRCIYAILFENNTIYIGLTFNLEQRFHQHINMDCPVNRYIKEFNLEPKLIKLTDYIDVEDAKILEGEYVEKYRNDGWNILNKAKTGGVGGESLVWTKEKCKELSLLCSTTKELKEKYKYCYKKIIGNKWYEDLCSHLTYNLKRKTKGYWTKEKCQEESLKYNLKMEFKNKSNGAYNASVKNKWLDEICKHMIIIRNKKYS